MTDQQAQAVPARHGQEAVQEHVQLVVDALRTISGAVASPAVAASAELCPAPSGSSGISIGIIRACADALEEQIASVTRCVQRSGRPAAVRARTIRADELARCMERHIVTRGARAEHVALLPSDQIRRFVETHFAEPLTRDGVAAAIGCAPAQVAATFKDHLGETMHRYLARIRVRRAVELIVQGDKIESAMLAVGYRSKKNFYQQFKRETGDTPAAYRDGLRAMDEDRPLVAVAAGPAASHTLGGRSNDRGMRGSRDAWVRPHADAAMHATVDSREANAGVTIARASQLLGVSRRTVYYWIQNGKLQAAALPDGSRRIFLGQPAGV